MGLPDTVRIKLSSESAGSIAITPVVTQELSTGELVERILAFTGKDLPRVRELLRRGSFVSGASRMRWEGFDPEESGLLALLNTFPNPDPTRAFALAGCSRVSFSSSGTWKLELSRQTMEARRLLRRASFWNVLESLCVLQTPAYVDYSYAERADRFCRNLSAAESRELCGSARLLRFSHLRRDFERSQVQALTFFVSRSSISL